MDLKKKKEYTSSSSLKRVNNTHNNTSGKISILDLNVLDIDDTTYWTPQNKKEKGDKTKNKLN